MPAVGVGTNIAALKAQRRLSESSGLFSKSMERLASGLRINRASDDAAGLAISSALNTNSRVFGQAVRNVNDGISYLAIAQGALGQLSDIVIRQRELAEQAANGVFSSAQRAALDLEANRLVDEYNRIIEGTEFNGKKILQDLEDGEEIRIQAGYGVNGSLSLSLLTTTTTSSVSGGDGTFATAVTYDNTVMGTVIQTADINKDGNLDIFLVDDTSVVNVMLGNSDGSFGARASFNTGANGRDQMIVADFNDDTILDVLVGYYYGSGSHSLLLGNANGSLTAYTDIGGTSGFMTSGDINGDGRIDIVSSGSSGGTLAVRLSNGNGTFAISADFNLPASPNDVTLGYFNNDSYLDIAHLEADSSEIFLYSGNGNGTFTRELGTNVYTGTQIYYADIQTGDFNGDGEADLVTTITNGVSVMLGNGDGTFQGRVNYTTTNSDNDYGSIAIADYNGDGRDDLAVANSGAAGDISVLLANSNGTFQGKTDYTVYGGRPSSVVAGDFDNDGVNDLAVANTLLAEFQILLGNGTSTTSSTTTTTGVTLTASAISLLSAASARTALDTLATRQQEITSTIGKFGAFESRLQVANNLLNVVKDNYTMASSRIKDADIASESAEVIRSRILQQASSAVLAQANQVPALALTLLRG